MATEAAWELIHGKKQMKVCLDINRPSHGRSWDYFRLTPHRELDSFSCANGICEYNCKSTIRHRRRSN